MDRKPQSPAHNTIIGGVVAGSVGALALIGAMTLFALTRGNAPWYELKRAAAPFLGERVVSTAFDFQAVAIGLTAHLAVALAWGLGFALLFDGMRRAATIVAGFVWGFVVWIGMFYIVLPMVGLAHVTMEMPVGRAITYHLFYGLAVGVTYASWETAEDRHEAERRRLFREAHA